MLDVASVLSDNVVTPVTSKVPPIAASVPTFIYLATARPPDTIVPAAVLDVASVLSDNVVTPVTSKVPPIAASVPTFILFSNGKTTRYNSTGSSA